MNNYTIATCPECGRTHHIRPKKYDSICICKSKLIVLKDGKKITLIKENKKDGN